MAPRPPRPGPLVARTDLPRPSPDARALRAGRPGRVRRFVLRYGWRAYAVPLLTIATIAVLLDLALTAPATRSAASGGRRRAGHVARRPRPSRACPTAPAEGDAGPTPAPQVVGEETYVEIGDGHAVGRRRLLGRSTAPVR